MEKELDYLLHLARESARFAAALHEVPSDARVESCPDWNADDLLWHLGEVQWFWATVVRQKLTGAQAEEIKPDRPADRPGLLAFYQRASSDLGEILAAEAPVEYRFLHKGGEWRILEAVTTNLLNDPSVNGIIVNSRARSTYSQRITPSVCSNLISDWDRD